MHHSSTCFQKTEKEKPQKQQWQPQTLGSAASSVLGAGTACPLRIPRGGRAACRANGPRLFQQSRSAQQDSRVARSREGHNLLGLGLMRCSSGQHVSAPIELA